MSRAVSMFAFAILVAPAVARAEAPPLAADVAPAEPRSSRPEFTISAGLRGMILPNRGFDPYATNNLIAQGCTSVGLTILRMGHASILLFAEYAAGSRNATARGEDASLTLHRLSGGAETRYQLGRRFFVAARVAPAAMYMRGSITDSTLDRPLVSNAWTWGLDVSGGGGLLLSGAGERGAKFWMTLDFGYTFAGESQMSYAPAPSDDDPRKYGSVMLPPMKPAGATSKLGFAVSF